MAETIAQQERYRAATLNAARYRKQNIQQEVRKGLFQNTNTSQEDSNEESSNPSAYKQRLTLMKAGAVKEANKQSGAAVGATVGGALGSIVPIVGTAIGAFLGRFIGKKLGITGIILICAISILLFVIIFIGILKGICDELSFFPEWVLGLRETCIAVGS